MQVKAQRKEFIQTIKDLVINSRPNHQPDNEVSQEQSLLQIDPPVQKEAVSQIKVVEESKSVQPLQQKSDLSDAPKKPQPFSVKPA